MLLKAISLKYPFSDFVLYGLKDVINRKFTIKYRGVFLIHTSITLDEHWHDSCYFQAYNDGLKFINDLSISTQGFANQKPGFFVGAAIITDVCLAYDSVWSMDGFFNVVINSPVKFKDPFESKGFLKFWEPEKNTINKFSESDMNLLTDLYQYSKDELNIEY